MKVELHSDPGLERIEPLMEKYREFLMMCHKENPKPWKIMEQVQEEMAKLYMTYSSPIYKVIEP